MKGIICIACWVLTYTFVMSSPSPLETLCSMVCALMWTHVYLVWSKNQ